MTYLRALIYTACFAPLVACAADQPVTGESAAVAASATEVRPRLPGTLAPAFEVRTPDGAAYSFRSGSREKPVILTFFRGTWCPYCGRHLWAMRKVEQTLLDLGYELIFVSADKPGILAPYLAEKGLSYTLLSDNDLIAARAFGIAFQVDDDYLDKLSEHDIDLEEASGRSHHWLPVPATFVIGSDGIIDFQYVNPDYKVRVAPEVLVAAARAGLESRS